MKGTVAADTPVGIVSLDGIRFKPFILPRVLTRGKRKGHFEIFLTRGRKDGKIVIGQKKIVTRKNIKTLPSDFKEKDAE